MSNSVKVYIAGLVILSIGIAGLGNLWAGLMVFGIGLIAMSILVYLD